ncbi:MAG: ASPIC/UnbV domain-containing protein, partial [Gammaproteobacteria bacterium]|nr:ASPIC/UnbV domain-containing protein [Gammaproteobacteria bacterium]
VVNKDGPAYLLMNRVAGRGNWVRFRVLTATGRDAQGALVSGTVGSERRQRRVQTAGSYLAANDPRVHFGLEELPQVTGVEVRWPTGEREQFGDFEAGTVAELLRGAGQTLDSASRQLETDTK